MRKGKSLDQRMYGYELSGTEYVLIFENDNTGFVRYDGRSRTKFYLDPSPFLTSPKREVYILEKGPAPREGELIEVTVSETDSELVGSIKTGYLNKIKYVSSWVKQNPNKYIRCKNMKPDEYTEFFAEPFRGSNEYNVDQLAFCMSLCTVSSPVEGSNGKGGIESGVFGKKKAWDSFKTLMEVIPKDFMQARSKYYYNQYEKDTTAKPVSSKEVSISILFPEKTAIHVPITVGTNVREKSSYKENILYQIPFMRAYMLDSLLFEPVPASESVEKEMIDMIHSIVDTVSSTKSIAYNLDVGSMTSKLSSAFARLKMKQEFTVTDVKECGDMWLDMYQQSLNLERSCMPVEDLFRLTPAAFRLYRELEDTYGSEANVPIAALDNIKSVDVWELEEAFEKLQRIGAIYCRDNQTIRLIDFKF